jgi:glyoxylase-like metal-dependent hydrolase (beta-lactamase superfamily II)
MVRLSRRAALTSAFAGVSALIAAMPVRAAAPASGRQAPAFYRTKLGNFELTAVYDGLWQRPIDKDFVRNARFADVQKALAAAFMPAGTLTTPFTPLVVNTGSKLVLIDTGSGGQITPSAGSLVANLGAAGINPAAIDAILISNFHPDHIDGIKTKDNALVFPNAEIFVPQMEWAYWMDNANRDAARSEMIKAFFLNARRIFADIRNRVTLFVPEKDKEITPGIVAIDAPGHTPGHTVFAIASGGESMMALCDTTNHPWLFARHPEWQPVIDQDGPLAVRTRRKILDRIAADQMLIQGYHFPFPGKGHVVKAGAGYEFVPTPWQPSP